MGAEHPTADALDTTNIMQQLIDKVSRAVGPSVWADASPRDKQHMLQVMCCDTFMPDVSALPPSLLRRHTGKASMTSVSSGPYEDPYEVPETAAIPATATGGSTEDEQVPFRPSTLSGVSENGDAVVHEVEEWLSTADDQVCEKWFECVTLPMTVHAVINTY